MARAAATTLGARLVARAALVLFIVALARLLPVQQYGRYAYLIALAVTVSMLSDTGVSLASGREIARGQLSCEEAVRRALPVVGAATSVAALVVVALESTAGMRGLDTWGLAMLIGYIGANGTFNLLANVLRSAGAVGTEAVLQVASVGVFVGSGIALAVSTTNVNVVFLAFVAKEAAAAACALALVRRLVRRRLPVERVTPRASQPALVRTGLALAVGGGLLIAYTRIGLVVLANLGDAQATGIYAASSRLLEAGAMLGGTLGFALAPSLTRLAVADAGRARALALRTVVWSAAVAAVAGCAVALLRQEIVTVVFGRAYLHAAAPLALFAVGLPAVVAAPLVGQMAVALGRDRSFLLTHVVGLAVAATTLPWLASHGPSGVAFATDAAFSAAALVGVVSLAARRDEAAQTRRVLEPASTLPLRSPSS
jgi:O-antigen/teichoic acid export membrane protein